MFINIFVDGTALLSANKALGGVNLVSDVYILCVPMDAISKLQLSLRKKIGVMLMFTTGIMYVLSFLNGRSDIANTLPVHVR